MKLLTTSSHKIDLTLENTGVIQGVLNLPPATSGGGPTLCPYATAGCMRACLQFAGRNPMNAAVNARQQRLNLWFTDPRAFWRKLRAEIRALDRKHGRFKSVLIRLNGLSDLAWETLDPDLFWSFSHIQFMDYTKDPSRMDRFLNRPDLWPKNYHLTFSRSEKNEAYCLTVLARGGTVAVVFDPIRALPETWNGFPVVDGDLHDNRPADKPGTVIGLKAKGAGRKDQTGFVVR